MVHSLRRDNSQDSARSGTLSTRPALRTIHSPMGKLSRAREASQTTPKASKRCATCTTRTPKHDDRGYDNYYTGRQDQFYHRDLPNKSVTNTTEKRRKRNGTRQRNVTTTERRTTSVKIRTTCSLERQYTTQTSMASGSGSQTTNRPVLI